MAIPLARRAIRKLELMPQLRLHEGDAFITDNGNQILDCATAPIVDPRGLDASLHAIPGVVGTGLFIGMASTIVVGEAGGARVIERAPCY
jgi:ribose 5-phosphate isomerase A